ncbi:MAG: putative glycoside hydrolase family 15 protein, partial [Verrucomicrobia bacterium]|nr:putative glycoside hydrolase family 15 protein [Verrucomicrobiota bacterium]
MIALDRRMFFVLLAAFGVVPGAAARPWPDSSSRIVVFSDQLQPNLTAVQRQFAATNLAGTQKLRRSEIQAIRTYNTNFLCLHYQLGVGTGPELFVDGDSWSSDWDFVNTQSNWFLYNPQTQRVYHTTWNWYLMDVTYTNGLPRTGFPEYWITTCLARIRSAEDDGVFADSFTQDAYSFGFCNPSHPWIEDLGLCWSNWIPALHAFGGACRTAFEADPGGFLYLPNLGAMVTTWDPTDFGIGHGGMIEGFCYWGSGSYFPVDDWRLQMDRALALVRTGKTVICQSYPDTSAYTDRMFAVASYLLIKGARTYLCLLT